MATREKKTEVLPVRKKKTNRTTQVKITRENLQKNLSEGLISIEQAGAFLELDQQQIEFAKRYLREYNGDGMQCVADVYGFDLRVRQQYIRARSICERLLSDSNIVLLFTSQLQTSGLSDSVSDKVLLSLMLQSDDKKVQMQAVNSYNELTNRYKRIEEEKNKEVFDFSKLTDQQLFNLVELLELARIGGTESEIKTIEISTNEVNLTEPEIIN